MPTPDPIPDDEDRSSRDDRSAIAQALDWSTQITTICLVMVLPALGGHFLDRYLGTGYLFVILGLALGMASGTWQLIKLVQRHDEAQKVIDRRDGKNI